MSFSLVYEVEMMVPSNRLALVGKFSDSQEYTYDLRPSRKEEPAQRTNGCLNQNKPAELIQPSMNLDSCVDDLMVEATRGIQKI